MQKTVLTLLLLFTLILNGQAQPFEYNHPELKWRTFETDHFYIHYAKGAKRTALVTAKIAEEIYPHVTGLYDYRPKDKIHFVIKDTDDYSNGGAYFLDNKVEIWASNLDYIMRGTTNWLRNVITHEYTHMISIQKMLKSNLTFPFGFLQLIGYEKERRKDVVRGFPNTLMVYPVSSVNLPVWFAEGTAQHQVNGARYDYRDPHREMILRDRILHNKLLTYNEMTVFGKNSNGNESSYNQGFSFVDFLARRYGEKALRDICYHSSKLNALTFEGAFGNALKKSPQSLYQEWKDSLTAVYTRRTEKIRQNPQRGAAIEKEGLANIYPVWSPDGSKIAYVSNKGQDYFSINKLILYDKKNGSKKTLSSKIASSLSWSPDGRYIAYAKHEHNKYGSSYMDLFLYDLEKDEEIRLTKNLRGTNPDFSNDGKKIVFVSATNGLNQLNVYELPQDFDRDFSGKVYFNTESGRMSARGNDDPNEFRKVKFRDGKITQLLAFEDGRQIFHPRWSNKDSLIFFDTAIEYGRNLAVYNLANNQFDMYMIAEEELRYPVFQPGSPYLYYAASSTGIYNIYRKNLSTGKIELLTNVTGGAMMPAVNARGDLVYANYDSVGYHIFEIEKAQPVNPENAIYDQSYPQTIPDKNFDNRITAAPQIKPYKQMFTDIHILPRLWIDYGTLKPGFFLVSADVLNKYSLILSAASNKDFDYDLYGYFEIRKFAPTLFLEVFNMSANIKDDILPIRRGDYTLNYHRDINFDLTEARAGISGRVFDYLDYKAAYVWSRYNAKIDQKKVFDPYPEPGHWEIPFTFHYNYLKGHAFEWSVTLDMVSKNRHTAINPSGGRFFHFKHVLESNAFLDDFALSATGLKEVYKNYTFNRLEMDWEEYFENPFLPGHTLALRLRGGYIDRRVDGFFDLYAGGLIGMKGYSYFSLQGRQKLIGSVTYRFPLISHMDKLFKHIYFDKLYMGLFYDYGNAWHKNRLLKLNDFKRDVGVQLRLDSFSWSLFPTRFFAEAVYPLDEARNWDDSRNKMITYKKEWRFYFGMLYEFDIRERVARFMHKLAHVPGLN